MNNLMRLAGPLPGIKTRRENETKGVSEGEKSQRKYEAKQAKRLKQARDHVADMSCAQESTTATRKPSPLQEQAKTQVQARNHRASVPSPAPFPLPGANGG